MKTAHRRLARATCSDLACLLERRKVLQAFGETGAKRRRHLWPLLHTVCVFLRQVLNPGQSCREAVRFSNATRLARGKAVASDNTSAYCQARSKIPEARIQTAWKRLALEMEQRAPATARWKNRRIGLVDGSGLSMPDTAANQKNYPQPAGQKRGCGFPLMKFVGLFSLATGALHAVARGNKHVAERSLFHTVWEPLREGFDLLLGDRGFCSLCDMYLLKRQGVDTIFRNHQARQMNWKQGKRLGRYDRLVVWKKPYKRPKWIESGEYETLPAEWTVRVLRFQIPVKGFRTRSVIVATTLLDPVEFPAADIAELYGLRWSVELHLRDIKTTLAMDILRCLSPDLIHREFQMHWLAYNLIHSLMQEAALLHNAPLERLSFKGTLDTLRQWTPYLFAAESHPKLRTKLLRQFFRVIAHDLVPLRPHRSEPRAVKRRPKKFHLLNKPRHLMGNLPHINRRTTKAKQPA